MFFFFPPFIWFLWLVECGRLIIRLLYCFDFFCLSCFPFLLSLVTLFSSVYVFFLLFIYLLLIYFLRFMSCSFFFIINVDSSVIHYSFIFFCSFVFHGFYFLYKFSFFFIFLDFSVFCPFIVLDLPLSSSYLLFSSCYHLESLTQPSIYSHTRNQVRPIIIFRSLLLHKIFFRALQIFMNTFTKQLTHSKADGGWCCCLLLHTSTSPSRPGSRTHLDDFRWLRFTC